MLHEVSHDIRNPLNCIILMLEEMQNYRDLDYINVIQCITSALAGAKMLKLLVNDILDMAQIKAGKFSLNYS